MSTTAAMAYLGTSRRTLCAWCRAKTIPHMQLPSMEYRFSRRELAEWLKRHHS